ncbi:MAG: response regulator [Pseudomonadota bacterium]|nr:response regulator [Pseudomonadota bacterium]
MSTNAGPGERLVAAQVALQRDTGLADESQVAALENLTRVAVQAMRSASAFVSIVGERDALFFCSTGVRPPLGPSSDASPSLGRHLLQIGGPVAFADVREDSALRDAWEVALLDAVALLAVPLVVDGVPLGVLAVVDSTARQWTGHDERVLMDLAAIATHQIALSRRVRTAAVREAEYAERALLESHSRYRALVEYSPDAILVVRDDLIAYANPAAVRLTGASSAQAFAGLRAETLLVPPFLKVVRAGILNGEPAPSIYADEELTCFDGRKVQVEVSAFPFLSNDRPAILLNLRDVTERRRAEVAIRLQEAQLRLLVDQLPVLVWATDENLRVTSMQGAPVGDLPSPARLDGPVEELFGQRDPDSAPLAAQHEALAGAEVAYRTRWHDRVYDVLVRPLRREDDVLVGTVSVAMDVTEQVRLAEELREAHHLALVGQIAAGVGHEMNNLLGTVLGIASVVALSEDASPSTRADLDIVKATALRGKEITSRLLGFAREGMYRRAPITTADILFRVAERVREWGPTMNVVVDVPPALPNLEGDEEQVEAALMSLCENARDAMPKGGTLTISVCREAPGPRAGPDASSPVGGWIRVDIADTGVGMSEEVRKRAVEPFFTTKAVGTGVGLGLSMAYGVVRHHGGEFVVHTAPGVGTTVMVYLPVPGALVAVPDVPREPPVAVAPERGGLVLVVDDDEWVRFSSRRLLEAIGYEVAEVYGGPEAIALYRLRGPEICAVLLDMRMPRMDGAEVLRQFLEIDPDVRVILCTGFERDEVSQGLFGEGHVGFLGKPFTVEELAVQLGIHARVGPKPCVVS